MKLRLGATLIGAILTIAGCAANPASNRSSVPTKNVDQCIALCESTGMSLQSIVIVANQTGCVCGVSPTGGAEAAAGGAAVVTMVAEQEAQQRAHEQNPRY